MSAARWLGVLGAAWVGAAAAAELASASSRSGVLEFKLGAYKPFIDREAALSGARPYDKVFGDSPMLLGELQLERQFFQGFGSAAVALSVGYTEKFGKSVTVGGDENAASESTSLKFVPLRALAVYRFDVLAQAWSVPLVPYVKAGLVAQPWWSEKGGKQEYVDGLAAAGIKWGYQGTAGLAFLLDVLEPRLARDFDTDLGVNHSYLFGEYTHAEVNDFGGKGFDFSSRHWMFGLALEY